MPSYKRIIATSLVTLAGLFVCTANGYFEQKYFCVIQGSSVTVSIQEGEKLCFEYLAAMQTNISELDTDITRAEGYTNIGTDDDKAYWNHTVADLNSQKQARISLREKLIVAIDDYEWDLFLRIKWLTTFYLKPERELLFGKVSQANTLLLRLKLIGDISKYEFVLGKVDELQSKVALLDRIKFSQNFSELIPALKAYLNLPRISKDDLT